MQDFSGKESEVFNIKHSVRIRLIYDTTQNLKLYTQYFTPTAKSNACTNLETAYRPNSSTLIF